MIKISRELRRLEMPAKTMYLVNNGIPYRSILRIRRMSARRERLLSAAKLQLNALGDINGNLTAWIAGYSSEMAVRQEFGSHFALREMLLGKYSIPKRWKNLKFSWEDEIRRIRIPEEITPELAEETGIHIGDGNISVDKKLGNYRVFFSGNLINELPYYNYIRDLLKKIYNLDVKIFRYEKKNSCYIRFKSKLIVDFKHKILDLPIGPKIPRLSIPILIKKDKELLSKCIRGIFDTDFYLGIYKGRPHLQTQIRSSPVLNTIKIHLTNCGIANIKIRNGMLFFGGSDNTKIFFKSIGSSNPHNYSKFILWERFGKCPYYTTCAERLEVINGTMNFSELEKIEKERKSAPGRIFSTIP